jgi:cobalt-zinc-cadmium resistance protein CzcA
VINTAFAGQSAGLVFEGEKRFDLVVRLAGEQRKGLADVQNLLIPTPQGTQIPLSQVADVQVIEGPNQIQRENAQRRIIVGFNVRGRDVQSMIEELQQKVSAQIKLPPGYFITYGGAFENLVAAKQRLMVAVPVALLLILLLLYFTFKSFKQGLLIYSAIPLSAMGGIFALALRGMPFSISAGIGFIALFGVAVLNGIVLIAEFNRLKKEGETDLKTIVLKGTESRLRPVLMTAFVASLGFLPMALSSGAGAEVQRPLATVVIGGLLIATFLTLFVLPILYIIFEKKSFMKQKPVAAPVVLLVAATLFGSHAKAQTPITLQAAVDTAIKNNLSINTERLRADYLKMLQSTAYTIPQTNATVEFGQINSYYTDNKLSLLQSIKFPTVYARQKNVYTLEWKSGLLNTAVREKELKKQVTDTYYEILYLQQKQQLLQHTDSLFTAFLEKATLRLKVGETNILEKITAQTQQGQIRVQLEEVRQDIKALQVRFNWLLNSSTNLVPSGDFKMAQQLVIDTSLLQQHPYIQQLQQERQINQARLNLEKAKLSPDLLLGYNNMSMKGSNADGKSYSSSHRFNSVQAGVGIPIFTGAQKATIAAGRINIQVAESNYRQGLQNLQHQYLEAVQQYNKYRQTVSYYETSALRSADTIIQTATLQFTNGEINYLDWVMLTNNAINIQSRYLDAVRDLNRSQAELNSFTNQ